MSKRKSPSKEAQLQELKGRRIFAWIWLGVGLTFLTVAAIASYITAGREDRFARDGRTTNATVTRKWISGGSYSRRGPGKSYRVSYQFTTESGNLVEDTTSLPSGVWNSLQPRDSIRALYVPSEPGTHRLTQEDAGWTLVIWMSGIGTVLSLAGGLILPRSGSMPSGRRFRKSS